MIRAVVFDLDDTLFPERDFVLSGFRAVGNWLARERGRRGFAEAAQDLFDAGHRGKVFDEACARLGVPADEAPIQQLVQVYREHKPSLSLHADARWALDYFSGRKKLGLLTDGYLVTQRNKVEALGIASRFDAIVYSDELGRANWKPSPIPYRKAMEALQCAGPECVYVADNPAKDFVAAKELNWLTVQICRPSGEYEAGAADARYEAHRRINSLNELKGLFF